MNRAFVYSCLFAASTLSCKKAPPSHTDDDGFGDDGAGATGSSTGTPGPLGSSSGTDEPRPDIKFDVLGLPDGGIGGCVASGGDTVLTGTVFAPNGEIPVSGALVYTSADRPEGIPQQVYCSECAELDCNDRFTTTAPDGSFELSTVAQSARFLVVQKGQFVRITPIDIEPGTHDLESALTTLPGENDPDNGLYIPKIALALGLHDQLENGLSKMGLGGLDDAGAVALAGTESFDTWSNGTSRSFAVQGSLGELVSDPARLAEYHILFIPCSGDTHLAELADPAVVANIRDWVEAGGRYYVADWSNEWMSAVFPEYQVFHEDDVNADLGHYDSLGTALDSGLIDWLAALPPELKDINPLNAGSVELPAITDLPLVPTVDNWSAIAQTPEVLVADENGNMVNVGHKVWIEGDGLGLGVHPLTVTGQYGCGKVQFTTYHTAEYGAYAGLTPQELVLVYTILEIGVCQEALPPPAG